MQSRPMSGDPVRGPLADTVARTIEEAGPRVWDDMTVEVALCSMIRRCTIWRSQHAADDRLRKVVNRANVA
ncbi:hypothetical protein [Streptomyces axinellae]